MGKRRTITSDIGPTTTTPDIVAKVSAALAAGEGARLGRWLMLPPGRVFRLPESYRAGPMPAYVDEYEVATYGAAAFVRSWLGDWTAADG